MLGRSVFSEVEESLGYPIETGVRVTHRYAKEPCMKFYARFGPYFQWIAGTLGKRCVRGVHDGRRSDRRNVHNLGDILPHIALRASRQLSAFSLQLVDQTCAAA